MFKNFLQYSDEVLDTLSQAELERIVENCFISKTKNYELLAKITPRLKEGQLCPFFHAISILEAEAVKVMLANYNEAVLIHLNIDNALSSLKEQSSFANNIDMSVTENREKMVMIAELLFHYEKNITERDLIKYIDLGLDPYNIPKSKPLLKGMNYNSIEDVLLMHTYAPNKTQLEIRTIYTNLLNNSQIASDIMHFTAINLIKGDDLKIIFAPNITACYLPLQNIIYTGTIIEKFTLEALTIHELGHYALFSIFPNSQGMPFDLSKITLFETQNDIYGYHFNNNETFKSQDNSTQETSFFKEVQNDLNKFLKYEQGAKHVFIKAGELLGIKSELFAPYILSKDFMLFFKDNSFIDLFMDNFEARLGAVTTNLSLSRKKVFAEAYFSYLQGGFEDTCPNLLSKPLDLEVKFQDMIEFAQEQYLPYIIKKFALNDDEIWFLERIAELLNRAQDVYDCPSSYYQEDCNYGAYYQELIVRYAELKASGIEQGLLDSFAPLVQAWQEDITPIIEQARLEFLGAQKLVDFSYHV